MRSITLEPDSEGVTGTWAPPDAMLSDRYDPQVPSQQMEPKLSDDVHSKRWDEYVAKRIVELEIFADKVWSLSLAAQADLEDGDGAEVNGRLVELAELAAKILGKEDQS